MCLDLHADQIQGFFDIPIDNFLALPILADYFVKEKIEDIVVVAPDHGGTTRARKLAMVLDAPMAIIDKRRPRPNVAEVMNVIGEVEGKNCIIIDDMIDTAGTVSVVVKTLKERGAKTVRVCCTHALLSGAAVERLNNAPLEQLVVTNTAKLTEDKKNIKGLVVLSVATLLGRGILNIIDDKPVSDLFVYNKK